ncbi:MAG: protoporphyrinogen oxidase [Myxococcales bacterium]|nr:protoporphyrinogen oxidase [Myxococcales bacterium]
MERRVVVIGGGISGLAIAEAVSRHTSDLGIPTRVTVLEAGPAPGGKIQTTSESGFVLETGPHGFLDREPKMTALIDRLDLSDQLIKANTHAARRFIVRNHKLRQLPMSLWGGMTGDFLSWHGKLRLLLEPFVRKRSDSTESVFQFAARRIGREAAEVLIDAMVTGIYGGDPTEINLKAAFPRMYELEQDYGSLVLAQFALAKEKRQQRKLAPGNGASSASLGAPTGVLHSFTKGLGVIIDALSRQTEVCTETSAQRVERRPDGKWQVVTNQAPIEADGIISTLPAFSVPKVFGGLDPAQVELAAAVPYVPCSVVVHCFPRSAVHRPVNGFGFLVPGQERRSILGSIWASTVFPKHAPQGMVMFRTMLGGARRPELGMLPADELAKVARDELNHWMGISPTAQPLVQRVIPWERAIPQYVSNHEAAVAAVDRMEQAHRGLFFAGNAYRGVAMISCVAYGDKLGERVARWISGKDQV